MESFTLWLPGVPFPGPLAGKDFSWGFLLSMPVAECDLGCIQSNSGDKKEKSGISSYYSFFKI